MSDAMRLVLRPGLDANEGETKHERFLRLGAARMNKVLHGLDQIANLSSPTYEYADAEVDRMMTAIRASADNTERRLRRRKPEKVEFAFEASPPAPASARGKLCARGKL